MGMEEKFPKLKPKIRGARKPSKKMCAFLKPAKIMKEGKIIISKRCNAYIPGFEVSEEREICEICTVPEMFVREDRCKYIAPLDLEKMETTRWRCVKTGKKYLAPEQCNEQQCSDYEKGDKNRWEIARLGSSHDDAQDSEDVREGK
jgi:hypothetical protein